jgi:hypothetical protein
MKTFRRIRRDCKRLKRSLSNAFRTHLTWFVLATLGLGIIAVGSAWWVGSPTYHHQSKWSYPKDCTTCSDNVLSVTITPDEDHRWFAPLKKPSLGVAFTFALSLITVFGFLIAIAKIEQLLGQVTSLREFLEQAIDIIQRATDNNDDLWIVCHSPFIGNLSLRGTKPQVAFKNVLESVVADKNVKLHMIGYSPAGLLQYYSTFSADPRYTSDKVGEAFVELRDILIALQMSALKNDYYGSLTQPPFFLVASEYEAVIASALFVPTVATESTTNREPEKNEPSPPNRRVELIGFSTKDGSAIESLLEAYEFIRKDCTPLQDAAEICSAIAAWKQ